MNIVGILGGIGPESTIEYYRKIVSSYLGRPNATGNYPPVIINSIDMTQMLDLLESRVLDDVASYLASEIKKLESAGATFGVLASNTPHIVFDRVQELTQLPSLLRRLLPESCFS